MTQRLLPLWSKAGQESPTYTQLTAMRAAKWEPRLIGRAQRCIQLFKTSSDLDALEMLNSLSEEMSALDPRWFPFSVTVFQATLSPAQSANRIESSFKAVLALITAPEASA